MVDAMTVFVVAVPLGLILWLVPEEYHEWTVLLLILHQICRSAVAAELDRMGRG